MPLLADGMVVARKVVEARSFAKRLAGWMGRREVDSDEALYLPDCRVVHTLFMRVPIDVVFLDRSGEVVEIRERLAPWRLASCVQASEVVELAAGRSRAAGLRLGTRLTTPESEVA